MGLRTGFTLLELLLVIGTIGLLIGIVVPSLAAARRSARTVVCASNLRQWGLATGYYAEAYDSYLPRRGQGINPTQQIDRPTDWFNALPPFLNQPTYSVLAAKHAVPRPADRSVWSCPEAADDGQDNFWSYGMNMWLSVYNGGATDQPDKINAVGPQSTMALFADGPGPFCSVSPASAGYAYSPVARHAGRVNICFVDGHVDSFTAAYAGIGTGFIEHADLRWRVPNSQWASAQH